MKLAEFVKKIISRNFGKNGIYNLGSKKGLSKLEFSLIFSKYLGIKNNNYKINTINQVRKIKRSRNMLMSVKKFENTFKMNMPHLKNEIKNEVNANYLN